MSQAPAPIKPSPTDHTENAVRIDRLSHRYPPPKRGQQPSLALDQVSFDVRAGEIFGLLGPNGGGKSTCFRILCTLLRPSDDAPGCAHIFGHNVLSQPQAVRATLGVVFQNPSLDEKLTARENLMHQGHLYGLRGRPLRTRMDEELARFDLASRAGERVERFSGGMKRRLELAKALLHRPRLLLLDEPSTGLDPTARRQLRGHLQSLRDELGVTVLLTTHLMDEAEACDRLAVLNRGQVAALDRPEALKARVGGAVVTLELAERVDEAAARILTERIRDELAPWPSDGEPKLNGQRQIRFEKPDATRHVAALAGLSGEQVRRISVGEPTLDDAFLHLTGDHLG